VPESGKFWNSAKISGDRTNAARRVSAARPPDKYAQQFAISRAEFEIAFNLLRKIFLMCPAAGNYGIAVERRKIGPCLSHYALRKSFRVGEMRNSAILLVEDDENDIRLLRCAFRNASLANPLVEVRDGQAAIQYLSGDGDYADRARYPIPFLILLDLRLPNYPASKCSHGFANSRNWMS